METGLQFRPARETEGEAVLALYRAVRGMPGCVWTEEYPGSRELREDLAAGGLYVLTRGETILGALSVVPENELVDLPGWSCADAREIARLVIAPQAQGRGLAGVMVARVCGILRRRGCRAVHLSVAEGNRAARRTYENQGFRQTAQAELYGNRYFLMEKLL